MTSTDKQHIFFVDDEPNIRKAVHKTFERAGYRCTCFDNPAAALKQLRRSKCHILITDVRMPQMDGLQLLAKTKKIRPSLPVLIITGYGDVPMAVKAMKNGASNFIEKPLDTRSLLAAVETELKPRRRSDTTAAKPLTKAESRVLDLILQGKSNREIAELLHRSTRTVEDHRLHIMNKLDAHNLVGLIRKAALMGLFKVPPK